MEPLAIAGWDGRVAPDVDGRRRMAFVTFVQGRLVASACYAGDGGESAEIAFQVEDAQQGRGPGTLLLDIDPTRHSRAVIESRHARARARAHDRLAGH